MSMRIFVLIMLCSALAATGASADKLYTWKDKDGNVHITDSPPPEGAVETKALDHEPRKKQQEGPTGLLPPGTSLDLDSLIPDKTNLPGPDEGPVLSIIKTIFGENEELLSMFQGITIQWIAAMLFFGALGAAYIVMGVKLGHVVMVGCGIALILFIHFMRDMVTIAAVGAGLGIIPILARVFFGMGKRR